MLPLFLASLFLAAAQPDESAEPPMLFFLQYGDEETQIALGKPFRLKTPGDDMVMTLRLKPHRVFRYSGVRFHYPRAFAFKADFDNADYDRWTLSGGSVTITIFRYVAREDHALFRRAIGDAIVARHGKENVVRSDSALGAGDETLAGETLVVRTARRIMTHHLYSFRGSDGSIVVSFQETRREGRERGKDAAAAEKMLRESFRLTGK
ncbi:MAG: hypothetical protein ACYTDY_19960 [Planctomycetota bacterium]|jgi:hypothetical protein